MRTIPLSVLAGALLAALAAAPSAMAQNRAAPGDLGTNMAGEACRLAGDDIFCGGTVKTGGLHRVALGSALTGNDAGRRAAVAGAIRDLPSDGTAAESGPNSRVSMSRASR